MQTLHHRYLSIVLYRCCVSYSVGNKNTSKPKVSNNRNFQNGSFLVTYFERICATNFSGDCPKRTFALCGVQSTIHIYHHHQLSHLAELKHGRMPFKKGMSEQIKAAKSENEI